MKMRIGFALGQGFGAIPRLVFLCVCFLQIFANDADPNGVRVLMTRGVRHDAPEGRTFQLLTRWVISFKMFFVWVRRLPMEPPESFAFNT